MNRMTLLTSCVVILVVVLSAVRYVEFSTDHIDRTYRAADFAQPLGAAQMILIGEKLDINRASEDDLQVLRGVGPVRAARIVEDRAYNGPFASINDLTRVYGIGPKTLAKNRSYLKIVP